MSLVSWLAVLLGGGLGSVCRYRLSCFFTARIQAGFPLGLMVINTSGCFALGLVASLLSQWHHDTSLLTALLATGFLGGYTTFSAYALEGTLFLHARLRMRLFIVAIGSLLAGLLAAACGSFLISLL